MCRFVQRGELALADGAICMWERRVQSQWGLSKCLWTQEQELLSGLCDPATGGSQRGKPLVKLAPSHLLENYYHSSIFPNLYGKKP